MRHGSKYVFGDCRPCTTHRFCGASEYMNSELLTAADQRTYDLRENGTHVCQDQVTGLIQGVNAYTDTIARCVEADADCRCVKQFA